MLSVNVGILGRLSFQMEELKGLAFSQSSRDLFVSFLRLPFNSMAVVSGLNSPLHRTLHFAGEDRHRARRV